MVQNELISNLSYSNLSTSTVLHSAISQLDSLWSTGVVPIPDFSKFVTEESVYSTQSVGLFILGFLLFFVFFGEFFFKLIYKMCISFLYPRDVMKINEDTSLKIGFATLFTLSFPVCVSLLIRYEVLSPSFFQDLSNMVNFLIYTFILLGFFMLRKLILSLIGIITDHSEDFGVIFKYSGSFFILMVMISLILLPFTYFVVVTDFLVIRIILFFIIGILTIGYLFQIIRVIISSQVSIFFSFLYICTLEILPLVLLIYTAINLK